ncbi:MAG: hypothetical protein ACYC69_12830 [Thermodesulfovibrionales bacterium]
MKKFASKQMLILCGIVTVLFAVYPVYGSAEPREEFERPPSREQAEKMRKRVETLRIWKLTNALDLDEKTSARLLPVLSKNDKKRTAAEGELRENMRDMREALKERREEQLRVILQRLEQSHKTLQKINDEEREELRKILTVEQQARFIIFQQEFDMEIRRIIADSRERRPGRDEARPGRGRPQKPLPPGRE